MFDTLVFGGGGTRCVWQNGFLEPALNGLLAPTQLVAVSAGALSAVGYAVGNEKKVRQKMKQEFQSLEQNIRWSSFLDEKAIAPHLKAYRQALHGAFGKEDVKKLQDGPDVNILITRPPGWLPRKIAVLFGVFAYQIDLLLRGSPHTIFPGKMRFQPTWVKANDIQSTSELVDLLIAAGCIPPVIPLQKWKNSHALDGGLIDNAAIDAWQAHSGYVDQALVLVTRQYRRLPTHTGRVYVQPSEPIPASKLDFTDPNQVEAAFALGKRDGELFWTRIQNGVSPIDAAECVKN